MQQTKPVHLRTGRVKNIDGIEAIKPFVRLASKGRFQNVIFYIQDFANLWVLQEDIATKRPCWVYYIPMFGNLVMVPFILIIIRDGVGWLSCLSL